ncbi:SafA/ExsA family spore coat assembly protein [Pullulanibacillus sp. KACC 23026]|uniref:SafA/ExsA family spore coat assembly protein n=1 Tax=Pullulanibacillus sp. KACC 23026 TaxID=3028315 RepID=UPI0023AFB4B2|nr:SafA/ExsA family spore coat assembly protein [Pullulanibacillus sp. KACC 23026]WEG11693.1 SafA/ExsA family spore coat assembly protein [Pullulanibacillus sp. KACC 23026]
MRQFIILGLFVGSLMIWMGAFHPKEAKAEAGTTTAYIVQTGDSLWKIANKYQVGLSELIQANPQIDNPHLIYPGEKINVPKLTAIKSFENQVINLTNAERTKRGLPALKADWQLSRVARYKAMDMRDNHYFSHTSPTYGSPFTMITDFGLSYTAAAENIAGGQETPQAVVNAWMNSAGHRANILSTKYTNIGVGFAEGGSYGYYWSEMFIHP